MWMILFAVVIGSLLALLGLNFVAPEKKIERRLGHCYGARDPQLRREMSTLLGPTILAGNKVESLQNGDEIFPAMLEAIRGARHSITFETYIYWSGEIGRVFSESLAECARAGIPVHVLLDWVGSSRMDPDQLELMRSAGAKVLRYHPLNWYHIARLNNRTHRKVLVVDGRIAFTGGVGIADLWQGHAQDPEHWRDVHFRIEGPVVAQAQAVFMDNWIKTTGGVLQGEAYFPPLPPAGDLEAQMFSSSPGLGSESMQLMYLMAIASAEETIDLAASYFVPDDMVAEALLMARKRDVRLRILLPGKYIDTELVRIASRATWGPLLEAGAEIHEYLPTMYHCKVMIVDGYLVSVGSTNFDPRSFSLNDEASLNLYDEGFAAAMTRVFEQDLKRGRRITLEAWRRRPLIERIRERLVVPISSQL